MAGYHTRDIPKGILGEFSKVEEEFQECKDAILQKSPIMVLCELSDIIGAIGAYVKKQYKGSVTLDDVLKMTDATRRAFECGDRK